MTKLKIKINPFFWPIIGGAILTGQFLEIITLFSIVIIHELGHAFTAKSYGWKVLEIHLLPFGGMAKVDPSSNSTILQELMVALAGPIQNFLMIIIAMAFNKFGLWSSEWTTFFVKANLWIGVFNLLPIYPLDGEKILRSLFFLIFPFRKASTVSALNGLMLALLLLSISTGLTTITRLNLNGMILAIFFIYTNWIEFKQIPYRHIKFLINKAEGKAKPFGTAIPVVVDENERVIDALRLLKRERYHLYYLLSAKGEIVATIPEERLLRLMFKEKEMYQPIHKIVR